jgi:hypothetical protein
MSSCCRVCEDKAIKDHPMWFLTPTFIVCRYCGNKRCPKASWHKHACTNSNEPGQPGSFYGPEESWPDNGATEEKSK